MMTPEQIKERFDRDAAQWKQETLYASTLFDMTQTNPSYQRIIGLGPAAVPLIIDRLRQEPDHWFWALNAIVGDDKAKGAQTMPEAAQRWIEWYDGNA
jgi:hypothetical protein